MICHIHPGTNMVTTYFGLTWWDNEIDGDKMYPPEQRNPTEEERYRAALKNPEAAAARGLWGEEKFLEQTGSPDLNAKLKTTQFADFHGHGWVFRGVYNHDRKGNWLDKDGQPIAFDDPQRFQKAVHLADIHLEKGMHCADCHFAQDNHGNGKIYGEPRAAVEIDCVDCHGTIRQKATLITSGPAAPDAPRPGEPRGRRLDALRTPSGLRRFERRGDKLFQRSMTDANVEWEIVQTKDTITPGNSHFSMKSLRAKLMNRDGAAFSQMPADDSQLAHANSSMTCYACHTSWTPTCFGCHLQMTANVRRPMLPQRRTDDEELHPATTSGAARRRIFPGRGWNGDRASRCASAFFVRGAGEFAECEPRVALLRAADNFGGGIFRASVQHVCAAHGSREGNQTVQRLPCFCGE